MDNKYVGSLGIKFHSEPLDETEHNSNVTAANVNKCFITKAGQPNGKVVKAYTAHQKNLEKHPIAGAL